MNTMKNSIFRWVMPFFLGVVTFNILRAITDLTKDGDFWNGPVNQHIVSQLIVIGICYVFDIIWNRQLHKRTYEITKRSPFLKEYVYVILSLFFGINIVMVVGEYLGVLYMGNGLVDYILANLVFIPINLLYYTLIRSNIMNKHYIQQVLLLEKMKSEKLDTELKYLKAQYHPHFLFNALNTIYFQTKEEQARQSIELLSELLRYQLYNVNKIVTIGQEINFIRSYISFQQQRMSKRLKLTVEYDPQLSDQRMHPLLFQPLMENAFKYVRGEYWIRLSLRLKGDEIRFIIENSIANEVIDQEVRNEGIGVENLRRRLELLYPGEHLLHIVCRKKTFFAELIIKSMKD